MTAGDIYYFTKQQKLQNDKEDPITKCLPCSYTHFVFFVFDDFVYFILCLV